MQQFPLTGPQVEHVAPVGQQQRVRDGPAVFDVAHHDPAQHQQTAPAPQLHLTPQLAQDQLPAEVGPVQRVGGQLNAPLLGVNVVQEEVRVAPGHQLAFVVWKLWGCLQMLIIYY